MKKTIFNINFGEITYVESPWTGDTSLFINGVALTKTGKKSFVTQTGRPAVITGNSLTGVKLDFEGQKILIAQSLHWYEIAIAVAFFVLIIVWGASASLCSIIPLVGGALGGGITGALIMLGIILAATREKPLERIAFTVGGGVASFLSCMIIGLIIVSI